MHEFLSYLLIIVNLLLLLFDSINSKSIAYKLNLIQPEDYEKYNISFSFYQGVDNFLINRQLPIMKIVKLANKEFTSDFLINTGSVHTWVSSTNCLDCSWSKKKYLSKNKKKIIEQTFVYPFGIVSGFLDSDEITIKNGENPLNLDFVSIIDTDIMNTLFKFTGMIGIGLYTNKTKNFSLVDKIFMENNLTKIIGLKNEENKAKLYFGDIPIDFSQNLTTCTQINNDNYSRSNNYWGCKMDYILIGDEYDFYLTKFVDQYVLFDTLSFFHVAPFDLLDYFMNAYFYPNDKCGAYPIDYNQTIYRVECNDESGLQKFKSFNIILNGWAYRLGSKSLFDTEDVIFNTPIRKNYYYFKVLFIKNRSGWTLGASFFKKYFTAYSYENKTLLFNGPDRVNFTKYSRENMPEDNSVFILTLSIIGVFLVLTIIILWSVFYIKQRRILISYEMTQKLTEST